MKQFMAELVSCAFDMPSWAPRSARRLAGLVIVGTVLLAPDVFRVGMESWVQHQTKVLMERITPLLQPEVPVHTSGTEAPRLGS